MTSIFDNLTDETKLGFDLRKTLATFERVDIATGYLDLRGWGEAADLLDAKPAPAVGGPPAARVLVGMVAPADSAAMLDRLQADIQLPVVGADVHDFVKANQRRDHLVRHLRNQLSRGLPTAAGQATLRALKRQITEGRVELKVFTEKPLHGKTYVFHRHDAHNPIWSYVGSSNFTGAGLYSNLELNIDVQDKDPNAKLAAWFNDRWDDPFSLPISAEIIELIEQSWADEQQPTPFEVYLKVCHALSQDARDGLGYVLPDSMSRLLLGYQETAVRTLARRVMRRGGTMLGDVVGLGKTLTAVATALMLQNAEDFSTLVLCPKNLEKMWTEHLEKYDVAGRVVPYSMAAKLLPELKRFHLVICDESHNLRNNGTVAYEAIHDYVRRNNAKVLLLTATPYNLAFEDVANQIGLYIDPDDDLGIAPAAALAKDATLRDKVDGKINTLAAFRRSEKTEDWRRLMSDHLVRRTRSFVKRTAEHELVPGPDGTPVEREYLRFANGTKFFFPTRVPRPLTHSFDDDDPAALMEATSTLDDIRALHLPRYRLAEYDNPKAAHTPADRKTLDDIRAGRGNVSGFVRVGLFKRLSSSGHSFIVSLQRQRARNELFLHAIDAGLPVPIGAFSDKQIAVTDQDAESDTATHGSLDSRYTQLRQTLPASTKWVNSTVFTSRLRKDLAADNTAITGLLDSFGPWDPAHDSKINALVDLLRDTHRGEKVLIFSEYVDTAAYVADALRDAGIARVELVSGDTDRPEEYARRFSPYSNLLPGETAPTQAVLDDPIDVLVATDVLSEGQNLQDGHIVVNYDLPWAIIRIIQRAGRVDRIGQKSDTVTVYTIVHDKIEQQINLRSRIKNRLSAAASAFGSDEQFFGSADEVRILENLYEGVLDDVEDTGEGEADAVSEAWLVWSNVQTKHPQVARRVLNLQDMVGSTRAAYVQETAGGVACYVATASGVDAFAQHTERHGQVVQELMTPLEALRVFRAEPSTPTVPPRPDHFTRQGELIRGPLAIETSTAGALKGIRKWIWLRLGGDHLFSDQAADALNALHARPLTEHAAHQLTLARRNRYSLDDLTELLNRLHAEDRLTIGISDADQIRLVCSIGVVA